MLYQWLLKKKISLHRNIIYYSYIKLYKLYNVIILTIKTEYL